MTPLMVGEQSRFINPQRASDPRSTAQWTRHAIPPSASTRQFNQARITGVSITPVAFKDPPLLNTVGVHEPFALRAIVEVQTDAGVSGFGETYGDAGHIARLQLAACRPARDGRVQHQRGCAAGSPRHCSRTPSRAATAWAAWSPGSSTADRVLSAFDVAALDIQGKLLGRPVSDLLGGAVRESVQFSGYLFYKWAGHPGQDDDSWGAALDPAGIVAASPDNGGQLRLQRAETEGRRLPAGRRDRGHPGPRAEFPGMPLRIDPNGAWTVETSIRVGKELHGVLEYLEDPTPGIEGMAAVRREVGCRWQRTCAWSASPTSPPPWLPAQWMSSSRTTTSGAASGRTQFLAGITETFGLGLSMHSNSHLGISLAAMVHLAAATPNLDYACDTHWPWKDPPRTSLPTACSRLRTAP